MTVEIEVRTKMLCHEQTVYRLERMEKDLFVISICRRDELVSAEFCGDFFEATELFRTMVQTDTLPSNLCDICCDVKNLTLV